LTLASLTFSGASGNLASFIVDLVGATSDTLNITDLLDLGGLFDALVFNGSPDGTSTYLLARFGSISGTFNTNIFMALRLWSSRPFRRCLSRARG
jgi:hypothetical protein